MILKKLQENKYGFITHEWIPIKPIINLGTGKIILVKARSKLNSEIFFYCRKYPENTYIFQTRNPKLYFNFLQDFPPKVLFSTIIETNRFISEIMKNSPQPLMRIKYIHDLKQLGYNTMINIEPIMDFDIEIFFYMLITANPDFITISKNAIKRNIPEPEKNMVLRLRYMLDDFGINTRLEDSNGK